MQLVDSLGLLVQQSRPQHVGEEVVVAVPEAAIVERDEEEVGPIEPLEHRLPAAATGHGIAQRSGEPVHDRGLEQEAPDFIGLALEHLLGEVVDDEAVVAGEARDEPAGVVAALHRQRGELQRGDPPLGSSFESVDVVRRQVQAHRVVEVGGGLVGGEPQVGGTDLEQLAPSAKARQRQRRIGPTAEHQVDLRRQVLQQERHGLVQLRRLDDVVVVEHQHDVIVSRPARSLSSDATTDSSGWEDRSRANASCPASGTIVRTAAMT